MLKDVQFSSVCQVGFLGLGEESSHELYFYLVSLAFKKNITLFISLKAMGLSPRHLPGCFFYGSLHFFTVTLDIIAKRTARSVWSSQT